MSDAIAQSTPRIITNFDGIPQVLRDVPQWVLYHLAWNGKKFEKHPSRHGNPGYKVDCHSNANWGTFEQVRAVAESSDGVYGPGFVFTRGLGMTMVDVDAGDTFAAMLAHIEKKFPPTWWEWSVSGKGRHYLYTGEFTDRMGTVAAGLEVYSAGRFIAMTGHVGEAWPVASCQEQLNEISAAFPKGSETTLGVTTELGRWVGLSDERVRDLLAFNFIETNAMLLGTVAVTDGSMAFQRIVGDLDKITGDPSQIKRIVGASDFAIRRHDKWPRLFTTWLNDARNGPKKNTRSVFNLVPYLDLDPEAFAKLKANPPICVPPVVSSGKVRRSKVEDDTKLSHIVEQLYCGMPVDTPPPPRLSALIDLNVQAMHVPYRAFAEVGTVAPFAAMFARSYKAADGLSSAPMLALIAPSTAGKDEALQFWQSQFTKLNTPATPAHVQPPERFVNGSIVSVQALHYHLDRLGTMMWYRPDAGSDIAMLTNPEFSAQAMIRDYTLEAFDASTLGKPPKQPPLSLEGVKRGDKSIHNPALSLLWSCTVTTFQKNYSLEGAEAGIGTRLLTVLHPKMGGEPVPHEQVLKTLPQWAHEYVMQVLARANMIDELYSMGHTLSEKRDEAYSKLILAPYTAEASDIAYRIARAANALQRRVTNNEVPAHYSTFGRAAVQAKKYALLCAIMRDADNPVIDAYDMAYGLSFVLRAAASVATGFDTGVLGEDGDKERHNIILGWIQRFPQSTDRRYPREFALAGEMPEGLIFERARENKRFSKHRSGANEATRMMLGAMVGQGVIKRIVVGDNARYSLCEGEEHDVH